ncbi:MAG: hypothetical protein MHMPM18_002341 [Marteilia pararefringens]
MIINRLSRGFRNSQSLKSGLLVAWGGHVRFASLSTVAGPTDESDLWYRSAIASDILNHCRIDSKSNSSNAQYQSNGDNVNNLSRKSRIEKKRIRNAALGLSMHGQLSVKAMSVGNSTKSGS